MWCRLYKLPSELLCLSIQTDLAIQYEVEVITDHFGVALTSPEVTLSILCITIHYKAEGPFVAVASSITIDFGEHQYDLLCLSVLVDME